MTLAPAVMSAWTSVMNVASLPWAFWTVNCEALRPASVSDLVRYGALNSTYRVDETVSGRMTATLPEPRDASGLSLAMAEKSSVNDDVLSCGTAPPVEPLDDELGELLPQAATNSAALLATATLATTLETERKKTTSSVSGTPPGTGLLRACPCTHRTSRVGLIVFRGKH